MSSKPELLFVYNAESGIVNKLKDFGKKIIDKESYQCNLCGVTFGLTGMKRPWKEFINELQYPTKFIHRDEFFEQYERKDALPAVFLKMNHELKPFISKEKIDECETVKELISLVNERISELKEG